MDIKTKYQYTYFIHPYVIEEKNVNDYLTKLLNDKNCTFKMFEKEKDLDIFTHFLPNIKNTMFETFAFDKKKARSFEVLDTAKKLKQIKNMNCVSFKYNLDRDIQGKMTDKEERNIFCNTRYRDNYI